MKRKATLASATVLTGTCPDMCPEKERYDREAKRRLHAFEILSGTENLVCVVFSFFFSIKLYFYDFAFYTCFLKCW